MAVKLVFEPLTVSLALLVENCPRGSVLGRHWRRIVPPWRRSSPWWLASLFACLLGQLSWDVRFVCFVFASSALLLLLLLGSGPSFFGKQSSSSFFGLMRF